MWYVYIAQCKDGSLYTGIAVDPKKRIKEHNKGVGSKYVRSRRPAKLVYIKRCRNESSAKKREANIKSLDRHNKVALVEDFVGNMNKDILCEIVE